MNSAQYLLGSDVLGALDEDDILGASPIRDWDSASSFNTGDVVRYWGKWWKAIRPVSSAGWFQSGDVPGQSEAWQEMSGAAVANVLDAVSGDVFSLHEEVELPGGFPSDVLGMIDMATAQHQMDALKVVTIEIARALVKGGMTAIVGAISGAKQPWYKSDLPGQQTRDNVKGHLQWHVDTLAKATGDPTQAIYVSANDLKQWVMKGYMEANAVEAGAQYLEDAWNQMWSEIQVGLAKIPKEIMKQASAIASGIVEGATGIPIWGWGLIAVGAVGAVSYFVYKMSNTRAGGVFGHVAARRLFG